MKKMYWDLLSMSTIFLWLSIWIWCDDCVIVRNIAAVAGLLDMTISEIIFIANKWERIEQCVSKAEESYTLAHKSDNPLNRVLRMNFIEKNVYTFVFSFTSGMFMVCEVIFAAYLGWKYSGLVFIKSLGMFLIFIQMFGLFFSIHCIVESFVVKRKIKRLLYKQTNKTKTVSSSNEVFNYHWKVARKRKTSVTISPQVIQRKILSNSLVENNYG